VLTAMAADNKARSPFEGTWLWSFTNADGGVVTPRIRFKTKDGELTAISRFRAGSETPVTNLTFQGSQVSFDVVRERDGEEIITHYSGRLSGDTIKGKITARPDGEEQSHAWIAKRPTGVDGPWRLYVDYGGEWPMESRVTFKQEGEKLTGKIRLFRGETDIHRGRLKGGNISFEVERTGRDGEKSTNRYHGKFSGDKLAGKVEMNNFRSGRRETNDWDAVRAD
jgi:hypothetical protein